MPKKMLYFDDENMKIKTKKVYSDLPDFEPILYKPDEAHRSHVFIALALFLVVSLTSMVVIYTSNNITGAYVAQGSQPEVKELYISPLAVSAGNPVQMVAKGKLVYNVFFIGSNDDFKGYEIVPGLSRNYFKTGPDGMVTKNIKTQGMSSGKYTLKVKICDDDLEDCRYLARQFEIK